VQQTPSNPHRDYPNHRLSLPLKVLGLWHLVSLDAPTVAVVWVCSFSWVAGVHLPFWVPILLALAAWAVYIADRLLDARAAHLSGQTGVLRERHHFHWRHRKILTPLAGASACIAAGIVLAWMPLPARERNSVLAAAALVYFARVHSRVLLPQAACAPSASCSEVSFHSRSGFSLFDLPAFGLQFPFKELLVGILFTAACALPAWSRAGGGTHSLLAPALFFAALAWLNCHLIESWESGAATPRLIPVLLGLAELLLAVVLAPSQPRSAALLASGAASACLLALLDMLRQRLAPVTLRSAADLVLLTPLALLLL
jgi:hypothetical protein